MPMAMNTSGPLFGGDPKQQAASTIRRGLNLLGDAAINTIQKQLPGHFGRKGVVTKKVTGTGLNLTLTVGSDEPGIAEIEGGREPGKQPPPDVLLRWVQRKGLATRRQAAVRARTARASGGRAYAVRKNTAVRQRRQPSIMAVQRSLAFVIGRAIAKQGLPRHTGFKPSHGLFVFRDYAANNPAEIADSLNRMGLDLVRGLNG
jgi:hypothetical protein